MGDEQNEQIAEATQEEVEEAIKELGLGDETSPHNTESCEDIETGKREQNYDPVQSTPDERD